MSQINTRELVLDMLSSVVKDGRQSHIVLSETLEVYAYLDKRDRAFISRLFRGVLEYRIYLDEVTDQFSTVKCEKMKPLVRLIIEMGAYQILFMDHVPDSAACNESVELAKKRGFKNLSGFVNGVLRGISRGKDEISEPDREKEPLRYISFKYSLPQWLAKMWIDDYGMDAAEMMGKAALERSRVCVRVRTAFLCIGAGESRGVGMSELVKELEGCGVSMAGGEICEDALKIEGFDRLESIPAFAEGRITVQDESTMLAALFADVRGTDKVIDLCAAPGGKTIHLADFMNASYRQIIHRGKMCREGCVFARDLTEAKTDRIKENVKRARLRNVKVQVQDALQICEADIGTADVVMADLPCSGLGVIGRKPDIKINASPEKIDELVQLQRDILTVAASYVRPGGTLIYSTCTVSKKENEGNMRWFAENFPFRTASVDNYLSYKFRSESTGEGWIQILPGQYGTDGFFVAKFVKNRE